jgi:hypothetical protein
MIAVAQVEPGVVDPRKDEPAPLSSPQGEVASIHRQEDVKVEGIEISDEEDGEPLPELLDS